MSVRIQDKTKLGSGDGSFSVRTRENFPFTIGDHEWTPTADIREEFKIHQWARIAFDLRFADGSSLTDARYRNMLEVIQRFLREQWVSDANGLYSNWLKMRAFVLYLVNVRKVTCLSQAWGIDQYVAYKKNDGTKLPGGKGKKKRDFLTARTLYSYLRPVKELWRFSSNLEYGLKVEPWVGRAAAEVAGIRGESGGNIVLPYDLAFFSGAIRVIHRDLMEADATCTFLLSPEHPFKKRIAAAARLRTAAVIAFLAMEGMRAEEVYSLPLKCLVNGKLNTEDGKVDVTWIDGRIYKDKPPGGEAHRWLAADEVILAVEAMSKLWRALEKGLSMSKEKGGFPDETARAIKDTRGYLFPKLSVDKGNRYFSQRAGLPALKLYFKRPECAEFTAPGTVINHQRFRPTIARAVARLRLGDVRYFMSHFGHSRWSITADYFATFADDELQNEIEKYEISEGQNEFDRILSSSTALQGGRGKEFEPQRRNYAAMSFESKKALQRALQRQYKIRIGPQSLCVAEKGGKLCSQDCLYEQERCLNCDKGVVADFHIPIWTDMWSRNQELLAELPPSSPGWINLKGNQAEIEAAIRNLGGAIPL